MLKCAELCTVPVSYSQMYESDHFSATLVMSWRRAFCTWLRFAESELDDLYIHLGDPKCEIVFKNAKNLMGGKLVITLMSREKKCK